MKVKITLLSFVFVLVSCIPVVVSSDYDESINFAKYKTYAFYEKGTGEEINDDENDDELEINDLDKRRIMTAIKNQLESKGMTFSKTPNVYVRFLIKNTPEDIMRNEALIYSKKNYPILHEASFFIEIIDSENNQLIWQGKGTTIIPENIGKKAANIDKAVKRIMTRYPPQ